MVFKGIAAFLLALVFQLAQLPCAAAIQTTCQDGPVAHCECCAGLPSCPCATDGDKGPERPALPVMPEAPKLPAAKLVETRVALEAEPAPHSGPQASALPATEPIAGYAGVRLAVAFCSYLM